MFNLAFHIQVGMIFNWNYYYRKNKNNFVTTAKDPKIDSKKYYSLVTLLFLGKIIVFT